MKRIFGKILLWKYMIRQIGIIYKFSILWKTAFWKSTFNYEQNRYLNNNSVCFHGILQNKYIYLLIIIIIRKYKNNIGFIDNWKSFWGRPDLLKRDGIHPSRDGTALLSSNMEHSLRAETWQTTAQVRKQTYWLNRPSASCLTLQKSDNSQHIETLPPRYYHIETVSVPRISKNKKLPNPFKGKNVSDVQQIKNKDNTDKQMIKLGLLNISCLSSKALIVNYIITDNNLDYHRQ